MLAVEVEVRVVGASLWLCSLAGCLEIPPCRSAVAVRGAEGQSARRGRGGEGPVPGGELCFLSVLPCISSQQQVQQRSQEMSR